MREFIEAMQLDIKVVQLERDITLRERMIATLQSFPSEYAHIIARAEARIATMRADYIDAYELRAVAVYRMMKSRDDSASVAMVG